MKKNKTLVVVVAASVASVIYSKANAQSFSTFTPGDIVVLQGGDSVNTQTIDTGTVTAYLDEFTPTGSFVGSIPVPASASGSNNALTLNNVGVASHEGVLTLSENHQYLTFAGYNMGAGTTAFNASAGTTGTVGIIGLNTSSLNTSTTVAMGVENVRAATTVDGSEFYVAEAHAANTSLQGGINYVNGIGGGATTTVLGPSTLDARNLQVLGGSNTSTGVLVAGDGSSSFKTTFGAIPGGTGHGVYQITASAGGLPNSTNTTLAGTQITSDTTDGTDVVYDSEPGNSNSYHGYNTMYLTGSGVDEGQIEKYTYNGTQFVPVPNGTSIVESAGDNTTIGLTEQYDYNTGNIDVFYTEAGGLYELNAADSSTTGFLSTSVDEIAAPAAGAAFYGVANAVPEPTSIALLGIGAVSLLGRRRRSALSK